MYSHRTIILLVHNKNKQQYTSVYKIFTLILNTSKNLYDVISGAKIP